MPDLLPPAEIGEARLERRRELREIVDGAVKNFEASPSAQLMDANFASAYRLMTSVKAREVRSKGRGAIASAARGKANQRQDSSGRGLTHCGAGFSLRI